MPERYANEWWHIQAPPLVFPSDDFAEAMTQAIVRVHREQLDDTGGFTVERANDAGSVSNVVDRPFCRYSVNRRKNDSKICSGKWRILPFIWLKIIISLMATSALQWPYLWPS